MEVSKYFFPWNTQVLDMGEATRQVLLFFAGVGMCHHGSLCNGLGLVCRLPIIGLSLVGLKA
jgi:hypothetical protein